MGWLLLSAPVWPSGTRAGGTFTPVPYKDNLVFDRSAGPLAQVLKIHGQDWTEGMIQTKIQECRSCLAYLQDFITDPGDVGRIGVSFSLAYQALADSMVHLQAYLSTVDKGDGILDLTHLSWEN